MRARWSPRHDGNRGATEGARDSFHAHLEGSATRGSPRRTGFDGLPRQRRCARAGPRAPTDDRSVRVVLRTAIGRIDLAIDVERAPLSGGDFLRYVERGLYDGGGFYRVVRPDNDSSSVQIAVVQGGVIDPAKQLPPIAHEPTNRTGILHRDGVISLARSDVGTGTAAAFFICIGDQPELDFGGR
ncbi:MAG: peptidylprolyl isomerase, partial [Steroidobacteraceae bacterium]